jgi:hypothetical protein
MHTGPVFRDSGLVAARRPGMTRFYGSNVDFGKP